MNFAIVNLGCKVNRVESDDAAVRLLTSGWHMTSEAEASLIVINTCTVTGEAEKKTRKAVRHALRANDFAQVMVTGCASALDPTSYTEMDARVCVVPKAQLMEELLRVDSTCATAYANDKSSTVSAASATTVDLETSAASVASVATEDLTNAPNTSMQPLPFALLRVGERFPTRVGVKVQDGCDNACTYCIVHVARGHAVSRCADEVAAECVAYAQAGVREIVLTGINLGSYCDGNRRDPQAVHLTGLLERLLRETVDARLPGELPCRFRISSIEPGDVDNAFIDLLARANGRVCRHLHLPLQAGSDRILRAMARPYRVDDYVELIERLRSACPSLSLSTDIIVGFPGETDGDFLETLAVARRCNFSKIHVFPYSCREGTPAAARDDQVFAHTKTARAAVLRALGEDLHAADFARRAGSVELALVEASGVAMTESYYEVTAPIDAAPGTLVKVTLPPLSTEEK